MSMEPIGPRIPEWTVADRLRRVRRDAGMTQGAFARELGIDEPRYQAWESGRNQPPMRDYIALAKRIELAFNVRADWMLGLVTHDDSDPDEGQRARRYSKPQPSDPNVRPLPTAA